jgi:hypothetical protein
MLELQNYLKICESAIQVLNKRKEQILNGTEKEELNNWWHKLIQSTVITFLEN